MPLIAADLTAAPLALLLRDIHPGPDLLDLGPDPRVQGWGWLLLVLWATALLGLLLRAWWRYRLWQRQIRWDSPDLVPRLQAVLRQEALRHWPEAGPLQGPAWLAFLDHKGGSHFSEFAEHWPRWLYGKDQPDQRQQASLRHAYRVWGRATIWRRARPSTRRQQP